MTKRLLTALAITVIITHVFFGCAIREREKNMVSVSIAPLKYFVDQLTDSSLEVNIMVPQGASHGTYSPTASQMQKLSDSRIYLRIGSLGYEQAFIRRLHDINPEMHEINLLEGVDLIRGEPIDHGDHIHEGGIDPHIWMSPKVMLQVLPLIKNNLILYFPELEEVIESNYDDVLSDISAHHTRMKAISNELTKRQFMIFHPALTYLARDYDLEQISIEHEGKEPSPAQLGHLIKKANATSIPIIFIQQEYDITNADLIAAETNADVVTINPLAYEWSDEMETIAETLNHYLR